MALTVYTKSSKVDYIARQSLLGGECMIRDAELLKLVMEDIERPTRLSSNNLPFSRPKTFRPIINWPQWIWKNLSANK